MEIPIALQKIYEVYEKGNRNLGCGSRASILYCIMKDKGLSPERMFFTGTTNYAKINNLTNNYVVILNGMVYNTDIEPSKNQINFNAQLVKWRCWNAKDDMDWSKDLILHYLSNRGFDEKFQEYVRPLIEKYILI